jgi:predicted amidophosphoribosyltransferase
MLSRERAVAKSSFARPGERPSASEHYESMTALPAIDAGNNIVIVDDVVTKGSTALAAASRIVEVVPEASVRVFAMIRTKGLVPDIDRIVEPTVGTIRLSFDAGDRHP